MNPPFVSLCPEITRADALTLMDWLQDEQVTRHLSDSRHVWRFIEQAVDRVRLPVLTHLFNQGGRFFMACDRHDMPVGFVRLVQTGPDCEMVVVIGRREHWGRRFGAGAIREAMKLAFLEMQAERLVARIHPDNARSLQAFRRCGFAPESRTPAMTSWALTSARYRRLLREGAAGPAGGIRITGTDEARLRQLVAGEPAAAVYELEHEIERAAVVDARQLPREVVTMNSRALLQLDGAERAVSLVYPQDADGCAAKLSVCSGLGTAILGYSEGDAFDWRIRDRTCQVRIAKLLYQPEAAGDFHL